jgi:ketosteroid isomerase-like protein
MSQENLRRVRQSFEVVQRTHAPDFDVVHPEAEWHTRADLPDTATYRGHDEIAGLLAEWFGAFERLEFDVEEMIDADDRVIAVLRLHGIVRGSDQEVSMSETHVLTMRDGMMIELREYATKEAALQAEGLPQ